MTIDSAFRYKSGFLRLLLVLTLLNVGVFGQAVFFGECPRISVVQDFDTSQYLGKWYLTRNYPVIRNLFSKCFKSEYTQQDNGIIGVKNSMVSLFNTAKSSIGQAKLAAPSKKEGKLSISVETEKPFSSDPYAETEANYFVLATDYTSYSVVWSCKFKFLFNAQYLWILTRERIPSSNLVEEILSKIRNMGLNTNRIKATKQMNCD